MGSSQGWVLAKSAWVEQFPWITSGCFVFAEKIYGESRHSNMYSQVIRKEVSLGKCRVFMLKKLINTIFKGF